MSTHFQEVEYSDWLFSIREYSGTNPDGSTNFGDATIVSTNGYCVAVKPKLTTVEDWKPIAELIINYHNNQGKVK